MANVSLKTELFDWQWSHAFLKRRFSGSFKGSMFYRHQFRGLSEEIMMRSLSPLKCPCVAAVMVLSLTCVFTGVWWTLRAVTVVGSWQSWQSSLGEPHCAEGRNTGHTSSISSQLTELILLLEVHPALCCGLLWSTHGKRNAPVSSEGSHLAFLGRKLFTPISRITKSLIFNFVFQSQPSQLGAW